MSSINLTSPTNEKEKYDLTNKVINEIERVESINNSPHDNLLNESNINSKNRFNVSNLRKIKSNIDLKLSKFFNLNKPAKLTSLDFPFNDNNIFKFNINYYNNFLQSSNELNKYMFDNIWLLHQNTESKTFKPLNNIIDDLKLFENIQSNLIKLIEHQNTYKDSINLINNHIQDYNLQYQFSKDELYNNQFNNKLFE
jgi:hypothetical protein